MNLTVSLRAGNYAVDISNPCDISIPLVFNDANPVCWGAPMARAKTYCSDGFVGDTRQGGSCNVAEYHIIPHCQGTHTECVGHITNQPITIHHLRNILIPSTLITVIPSVLDDVSDRYFPDCYGSDFVITRSALESQLQKQKSDFSQGLIIRTLPNDATKKTRNYLHQLPPFLTLDAIAYITQLGVQHLLV
ncbi:MAG: cyclase family protein, partial [Cyanobacteria bacterium J06626_14]